MPDSAQEPATKGDLKSLETRLDQKIGALDQKIDTSVQRLDQKIGALDQKIGALDQKIGALDHKVDALDQKLDASVQRLAMGSIKTGDRIDKLEESLRKDMRQLNSDVTAKLDSFTTRMETLWRESAVLPHAVDEHAEKLRDHEERIKSLESSQRR